MIGNFQKFFGFARSVYLHHVGKTGGTTLDELIKPHFRKRDIYRPHGITKKLLAHRYRYISGHMLWQVHELQAPPTLIVTCVRDPIEHFISTFRHLKRVEDHLLLRSSSSLSGEYTVDDFLADDSLAHFTTNPQCFSLSRHMPWPRFFSLASKVNEVNWKGEVSLQDPNFVFLYGGRDEDRNSSLLMDRAIDRISGDLVAAMCTEKINRQWPALLEALTGRPPIVENFRKNVATKNNIYLTEKQKQEIKHRTKFDSEIHKFIKSF